MTDSGSTYGSMNTARVEDPVHGGISLPANTTVSSDLLGLLSIISILILLLLSEGNILLGIIS